ncbi:MAG: rRNA maturation RNase YbeY [Candidatus Puniceispirillales bacterium]
MKNINFSSKSKLVKFDIEIDNPSLWKDYKIYFDSKTMNFFSKVVEKTINKNILTSFLLTDDTNIKILNYKWRKKNSSTNVLSFPVKSFLQEDKYFFIGDIVLSYETILKECKKRKISFKEHFIHLCLHGILHLLGFDHKDKKDEKVMECTEIKFLSLINIQNPYLID